MDLLERESALATLTECARRAANGAGRLVLISGEAGIGKSALVERFLAGRTAVHAHVAACDGLFTPAPLAPLLDLAETLGGELVSLLGRHPVVPRDRLFAAVLHGLTGTPTPSVLVLEDIHWADEATLDLLRYAVARIRTSKVLVLATYRTDTIRQSFPLRVAIGELVTRRWTTRISLEPLSAQAVAALAQGTSADPAELYRLTGGNPFFVTESLGAGLHQVSPSVRDAVLGRAAGLDSAARSLLEVAALIGTSVDPGLLLEAGSAPARIIDDLTAAGLLVADGSQVAFRHEIARRAVAEGVGRQRAKDTHGRILAALVRSGCPDHARLAFHADESGDGPTALTEATLAARQAVSLGSHREAAAQLERALRFAAGEPADRLVGRYLDLAAELQQIDRIPDADDAYGRALDLARVAGDAVREGRALRGLAETRWLLARGGESRALADQAARLLCSHGSTTQLAAARVRQAGDLMAAGRLREAIQLARRARDQAERLGAPEVVSFALNREAAALWYSGGDWKPRLLKALQVALDTGAEFQAGYAHTNLHEFSARALDFAAADQYYADAAAYCAEHEVGVFGYFIAGDHAVSLERRGRWAEAVSVASGVLHQVVASPVNRMISTLTMGRIQARRGEPAALATIDQGTEIAVGTEVPDYLAFAWLARAEALWLAGRSGDAQTASEHAADAAGHLIAVERGEVATWLRRLGSCRLTDFGVCGPHARHLLGDAEGAGEEWLDRGCPYLAALAWYDCGTEEGLHRALEICTELGATATAVLIRRRMRALGLQRIPTGRRAATRANPLGLTAREHDVLALLAQGRTNQEIADRLVVSTRTVDHHVSAVLGKLGVTRRGQAIAAASRMGLASAS